MTEKLILKNIGEGDYEFLFSLLKNRKPNVSISHREMPTYSEHVKFVESEPYHQWHIILLNKKKIGSVYLSKNDEIGISLVEDVQGKNIGSAVLKLIMEKNPRERFLANINPNNFNSKKFFEKNGFKLIQYTFEKIN